MRRRSLLLALIGLALGGATRSLAARDAAPLEHQGWILHPRDLRLG